MYKFVFVCFLIVCCISCENSYPEWDAFFENIENNQKKDFSLGYILSSSEQLKVIIESNFNDKDTEIKEKFKIYFRQLLIARNKRISQEYVVALNTLDLVDSYQSDLNSEERTIFEHEIALERILNLLEINDSKTAIELLNYGLEKTVRMENNVNKYYHCNYLLLKSSYLYTLTKTNEALSNLHYALHIMSKNSFHWSQLKFQLLDKKRSILNDEISTYNSTIMTLFDSLSNMANSKNQEVGILGDMITFYSIKNEFEKADSLISLTKKQMSFVCNNKKSYVYSSIGFSYLYRSNDDNSTEKAINYLDKANMLLKDTVCVRNFYVNKLYKAILLIGNNELNEALAIINKLKKRPFCNMNLHKTIEFYINDIMSMYYSASLGKSNGKVSEDMDKYIDVLLECRILSKELYQGDLEYHLDDYYVSNCTEIYRKIANLHNGVVPTKYHKLILSLSHETKNKELNRVINSSNQSLDSTTNSPLVTINNKIIESLRKCNDFKSFEDYGEEYYKDIHFAYIEKNRIIGSMESVPDQNEVDSLDFVRLRDKLKIDKLQILDFVYYQDLYWYYIYDGEDMHLDHIESENAKTLMEKFVRHLSINSSKSFNGETIRSLSCFSRIDNKKTTYLLPDGVFSSVPYDFLSTKTIVSHNLNNIAIADKVYVNPENGSTISFSDTETRSNMGKSMVSELYNDYEECNAINSILKIKDEHFFHGASSTIPNFIECCKADLLHISSHAASNMDNRLSSYIYLRDKVGKPQKLYQSKLYSITKTPKFVCLSTCESGIGNHVIGQGVYSLARPFFQNGTQTVLKSLWKVDDKATREFMTQFYTDWNSGISVNDALIKTKKEFEQSDDYSNPYYWAAFLLEGNPDLYIAK